MANQLLNRLMNATGNLRLASRRALATNANVQIRRAMVKQSGHDQQTLEILARRGPFDVTLAVASHPDLQEATARVLMRLKDRHLQSALQDRFGDQLDVAPEQAVQAAAPAHVLPEVHEAVPELQVATDQASLTTDIGLNVALVNEPHEAELATAPDSAPFMEVLDEPALQSPEEANPQEEASYWSEPGWTPDSELPSHLTQPESVDAEGDSDFQAALDEFERGLDLIEAAVPLDEDSHSTDSIRPSMDRHDEAAELRFVRLFQRIPKGLAGHRLLERLAEGNLGQTVTKLQELHEAGLNVDELALAWFARNRWQNSHAWEVTLDYQTIGALIRTYPSTPDPDELLHLLELLEENFYVGGYRSRRREPEDYIRSIIWAYESYVKRDGYVPLELILAQRKSL